MSTGSFCVPTPCEITGNPPGCLFVWCFERNNTVNYNSLYTIGYITRQYVPIFIDGVSTLVQDDLSSWITREVIISTVPYVLTFITLFITLMIVNVISIPIGIVLIISIIALTAASVTWILEDTDDVITSLNNKIRGKLTQNFDENKTEFFELLVEAVVNPDSIACPGGCVSSQNTNIIMNESIPDCHCSENDNTKIIPSDKVV